MTLCKRCKKRPAKYLEYETEGIITYSKEYCSKCGKKKEKEFEKHLSKLTPAQLEHAQKEFDSAGFISYYSKKEAIPRDRNSP